ncbi:hypothetical protein BDC45DRAFT_565392 [Circinella umbellata]|nr:hypothetical protein BDC45DRAFT_565392 [Circinella umbellata]
MCDLNWCPVCDKATPNSLSLYCSDECLQKEVSLHNPLLGYEFDEFKCFLATPTKRRNLRMYAIKNFNNNKKPKIYQEQPSL